MYCGVAIDVVRIGISKSFDNKIASNLISLDEWVADLNLSFVRLSQGSSPSIWTVVLIAQ